MDSIRHLVVWHDARGSPSGLCTRRHYAITSWLRAGIPVHVVQRMAGHVHLSTTQRYVHFLKADLEEAARRLPVRRRDDDDDDE